MEGIILTHYTTVQFPERYFSEEVKQVFADKYGFNNADEVVHYISIKDDICEFELDDSSTHVEIADALFELNVPAVIYCGSDYEYNPCYYLSYPKGDPDYPNGAVVEIPLNRDSIPVVVTSDVAGRLSSILNNLDKDDPIEKLREYHEELEKINFDQNSLGERLLGYYCHETDVG